MNIKSEHQRSLDKLAGYVNAIEANTGSGEPKLQQKDFAEFAREARREVAQLKLKLPVPDVAIGPEIGRLFRRLESLGAEAFFEEHCELALAEADWRFLNLGNAQIPAGNVLGRFIERPYLLRDREVLFELYEMHARFLVIHGDFPGAINSLHTAMDFLAPLHDKYWHLAAGRFLELIVTARAPWPREATGAGRASLAVAARLMRQEKNKSWPRALRNWFRLGRKGLLEWWHSSTSKNLAQAQARMARQEAAVGLAAAGAVAAPPAADLAKTVLLTRAMGGIGDLLMMTSGIHALREQLGVDKIHFSTLRRYFPLFEGNPDVKLIDIEREKLDLAAYGRWVDLSNCPAAVAEARALPNVQESRNDIFARAMGVTGRHFEEMDRRPRYFISEQDRKFREDYWREHNLSGQPVLGVQYRSAEEYRDYLHMDELIKGLAERYAMLIFHDAPLARDFGPRVWLVAGLETRQAFALASGCQVIVCPDSSFTHLAAALDLPCVALFGPTGEAPRTKHYPKAVVLGAKRELACVPCWRNNVILCKLSNSQRSVCMGMIPVTEVIGAVGCVVQMGLDKPDDVKKNLTQ